MSNKIHLSTFLKGIKEWNQWRLNYPEIIPDLSGENFSRLTNIELKYANLTDTDLSGCDLDYSYMKGTKLMRARLEDAKCHNATFIEADLTEAKFLGARLSRANMFKANCFGADFSGSYLGGASFVETQIENAIFDNCEVYGLSAWGLKGTPKSQLNLVVTPPGQPVVTVDELEVAQFIYLLLDRKKLRNVLDTITSKAVLILGRFTPERKEILDAMANELRKYNLLPIIFDFERPAQRDFTETIKTLAGISLFVIADITSPKSSPLELQATVPDYKIPFVPIIQEGENPFSMMKDLGGDRSWFLQPVITYSSVDNLLQGFKKAIIDRAWHKHKELQENKTETLQTLTIDDFISKDN